MIKDFNSYLNEIKKSTAEIQDENLFFWGGWVCEELFSISEDILDDYLTKKEVLLIKDILLYIWSIVDDVNEMSVEKSKDYLTKLQNVDETNLDQTDYSENALYELIISLDAVLNFSISKKRGFEYNLSQSVINAIDSQLQNEDIDILTDEGFHEVAVQKEINSQLSILKLMSEKKLDSNSKRLFR